VLTNGPSTVIRSDLSAALSARFLARHFNSFQVNVKIAEDDARTTKVDREETIVDRMALGTFQSQMKQRREANVPLVILRQNHKSVGWKRSEVRGKIPFERTT
jgi:hypothetical protein